MASRSLNMTHNSVSNQCCTVCGCPEGASTQNIVCHYVLLGWEVGKGGQERGKNVIFKNNPFPLNNAISRLFPVYSGCEISDARAFVTGFKGVSNNKGKLHPLRETNHFQTLPSCNLPFVLSYTHSWWL